jgi:hypothetical protein
MKRLRIIPATLRLALVAAVLLLGAASVDVTGPAVAETPQTLYPMSFPLDGAHSFTNTYGAPRDGDRLHQGIDIFADKLTPVVAVADGRIRRIAVGERAGRYIVLEHADGWFSYYLHLNNDSPGSDDGLRNEWVSGIVVGAEVAAGDLLDYVGDSGNAEATPAHLHFELHTPTGEVINPYPHLLAASGASAAAVDAALEKAGATEVMDGNTAVVGQLDPGNGFAAGLWVHADTVYMGTWGRAQACPAAGVRIIDVANPAIPELVAAMATGEEFPATDTDSVWVGAIETQWFTGEVGVVAVSLCDGSERGRRSDGFRGLAFYDLAEPSAPRLLSTYDTGELTQGVHDLDVAVRGDGRVLVAATVMQSTLHTDGERGDVRLVEMTDPVRPREIADWDFRQDLAAQGGALRPGFNDEQYHSHSVSFTADGRRLWVAAWDGGSVLLDLDDPAQPHSTDWILRTASAEGNVHSVVSYAAKGVVIVGSEDLHPGADDDHQRGWGYELILDLTGRQLSRLVPGGVVADADTLVPLDGFHSAHNAVLVGSRLYTSWYSSGVRIVDLADAANPVEIGYFIPTATPDPQGYWVAPDGSRRFAMAWDVRVADGLIFVSDMNSGLWIVRYLGDDEGVYVPR